MPPLLRCFLRAALAVVSFVVSLSAQTTQTAWTSDRTNIPGVSRANSVAFGNGRFVMTLLSFGTSPPAAAWSVDGRTWNASKLTSPQYGSVVFSGGAFYLVGGNSLWRSLDGDTWQQLSTAIAPDSNVRGFATNGRTLLSIASGFNGSKQFFSPDFVTLREAAALPESGPTVRADAEDVVYFAGRYLVLYFTTALQTGLAHSLAATTVDGMTWTPLALPEFTRTMASSGNRLVTYTVQGPSPVVITTTDGINFTTTPAPATLVGNGRIGYAGGRFFILGSMLASTDGVSWGALASPPQLGSFPQVGSIAYGNGRYVAVGSDSTPAPAATPYEVVLTLVSPAPPIITSVSTRRTVAESARVDLEITLENPDGGTTYQWRRNGTPIVGATSARYTIATAAATDAGRYTVDVRNGGGTVFGDVSTLVVVPLAQAGRIVNLSVLTTLDRADDTFTVGFVVGGTATSGTKTILARAGGPSLASFGVTSPNADPKFELWSAGGKIGENDNWSASSAVTSTATQVGAYPFNSPTSKDAALVAAVAKGDSSLVVAANNGATGPVLAEVYDATPTTSVSATTPRLVNVSVLRRLATAEMLTAGFVIGGASEKTVLIRAIGPGLRAFVGDQAHTNPTLSLVDNAAQLTIASNNDWGGTASLTQAFASVGAFELSPTSTDAALVATLPPGRYSAQVTGSGNASGTVLLEIYEAP